MGIKVEIRRDSVCMADDLREHRKVIKIDETTTLGEFILHILKMKFLPLISGGKATWVLRCNDIPLAVVAEEWGQPKFLHNQETKLSDFIKDNSHFLEIYFEYLVQINPDKTYKKLKEVIEKKIHISGSIRGFIQK